MRLRRPLLASPLAARVWWTLLAASGLALVVLAVPPVRVGPAQPIPFSHRVHAGDKQISCLFCHDAADRSSDAGMPAVGKCLLCHRVIATGLEPIQRLQHYYDTGQPVPWVRVYKLSDFAFFSHAAHLRRGVDCAACHGNVQAMDRIVLNQPLQMGFCVDCHRQPQYGASVDCWWCHR